MASRGTIAVRGAAVTLGAQWLRFGIQFAAFVVLSRLLAPRDFGVVAMITAVTGVAALVGDFGLSSATVQMKDVSQAQLSNAFWANAALGSVLTGLCIGGAPILGSFYHDPRVVPLTRVVSIVFLLNAVTLQFRAEAMRRFRFLLMAGSDVAGQALGLVAAVVVASRDHGAWALIAQQIVAAVIPLLTLIGGLSWRPSYPSRAPMGSLIRYGANVLGVQAINYASGNIDTVLVGRLWGSVTAGFYSRAFQLLMLPLQQVVAPLGRVAIPILGSEKDPRRRRSQFVQFQLVTSYVVIGALSIVAAFDFPAVDILFGAGWDKTKYILLILTLGGVFEATVYPLSWLYASANRTDLLLRFTAVLRPLMIALIVAGVFGGPDWAAAGVSAGYIINWAVQYLVALPLMGISRRAMLGATIRPMMCSGVGLLLCAPLAWLNGTWRHPWMQAGCIAVVLALAWAVTGCIVKPIRHDLRAVWGVARKMRPAV